MPAQRRRPSLTLVILHSFLALGAIGGGVMFLVSPDGSAMGLSLDLLGDSPFNSYLIPGVILLTTLGLLPALVVVGLTVRPSWKVLEGLNIYHDRHWSWTFSLYVGFILVLWIVGQVAMIRELSVLQLIFVLLGVVIQAVTLLPGTQRKYAV